MATIQSSCSPLHGTCTIGQPYGNTSTSYSCGFHTGIDFPASGVTGSLDLYACCSGTVVYIGNNPNDSLGIQVQIRDSNTGIYYRYCHMVTGSVTVSLNQSVTTATKVGVMGNTGNSTGTHLHLEASSTQSWNCNTFLNPGNQLGFGNTRGTVIEYNGSTPPPTPPTPSTWIYHDSYNSQSEMENNANLVINLYRSMNINDNTIAGILANMQSESTIQPILNEVGGGGGYGLVQWTPKSTLISHCSTLGYSDYTNGDNQCKCVIEEISGSSSIREWYTSSGFISNYYNSGASSDMIGITGSQFLSNSMGWSAEKLAIMFMAGYERPSYDPNVNHYQQRQSNATAWLQYMQGVIPPTPGTSTPIGDFYHREFNGNWFWSTAPGYTGSLDDETKKKENALYIWNYLKNVGWTVQSASVVIGAMDLVSTLNSAWKPTTDNESPFGLLGWRYWEFTDWVNANGEWVADSDYTIIDNSIGRICWFRQYNLAWNNVTLNLQQFSESTQGIYYLSNLWIANYAYNTLTLNSLNDKAQFWYNFLTNKSKGWKWIYGKSTTYNLTY